MDIFLFIHFFPYKKAEPFFINEFEFTKKHADSITVFSLYGKSEDNFLKSEEKVTFLEPVLPDAEDKNKLYLRGLLNTSGMGLHLKELFGKGIFLSPKKLYWFLLSFLIVRISLASPAFKILKKKIEASENPVLYFYWGNKLGWMIPYLKRKIKNKNLKIVTRLHGTDLYEYATADYAPMRQRIFSETDLIATVSENGKNYLVAKYPAFSGKIITSRLGVFDHGLNPHTENSNQFHLISVSNIIPIKRLHLIYEALQHTTSDIVWHHFGSGPLATSLEELTQNPRKGLEIRFHGSVNNVTLMDFYASQPLDLLLNVSSTEGLPVSIMEALSFGVPVIATNVGGTAELVNDEVGKLIPADFNPTELAEIIEKLLHLDADAMTQIRKNAKDTFETKVSAAKNYDAFYERIKKI